MRTKTGAGLGTAAIAIALTIGVPFANGEENSNEKNPFIGTWELTSDWGKSEEKGIHIIVVNPDLTGTVNDVEEDWTSKLRNVELNGEAVSFSFFWGETEEYEIEFEGAIVDKEITGEYALFGATAVVLGAPISAAGTPLTESQRLVQLDPPTKRPVPMVLDTDTYNEIDDQFALVYALISPELDVQAVYAAPFLNNRSMGPEKGMEQSYEEILRILAKLGRSPDGFAFKGSRAFIADPKTPEESPATRDLIARAQAHSPDNPLYVVAVGAITNVANALLIEPEILPNIVVVWLGGNGHDWPKQYEFNYQQDLHASRTIFDSGVPLVQLPCTPVVTHFATTVPEMEAHVGGHGAIGDYLLNIFKGYHEDHFAWSKVLWDMTAVAWVINHKWLPSVVVHSPIVTNDYTYSFDDSRHLIRVVYHLYRDPIFRDFFTKLQQHGKK
jgi:inosine-uridine nucleoside N-ribohydrolase